MQQEVWDLLDNLGVPIGKETIGVIDDGYIWDTFDILKCNLGLKIYPRKHNVWVYDSFGTELSNSVNKYENHHGTSWYVGFHVCCRQWKK